MTAELIGISKYKEASNYENEQLALRDIAKLNNLTVPQVRARLVILGFYHNKEKKSTRILKVTYVEELAKKLDNISDTEFEYLERLTVALLKKISKAIK